MIGRVRFGTPADGPHLGPISTAIVRAAVVPPAARATTMSVAGPAG